MKLCSRGVYIQNIFGRGGYWSHCYGWNCLGREFNMRWGDDLRLNQHFYIYFGISMLISTKSPTAAAKLLQSCLTLCDTIESSPPGSPIPGILQARVLEWVAISFSNAWKWKVKVKSFSCVQPVATPSTAAYQAPLSMGFSRQEYWSGLPLPSPQKVLEQFYSDCFDPVEQFRRARHLNSIDSSSPWAWYSSPFI